MKSLWSGTTFAFVLMLSPAASAQDASQPVDHSQHTDHTEDMDHSGHDMTPEMFDEIREKIAERFVGIADSVHASTSAQIQADWPPGLIADVQGLPQTFERFATE